MKHKKIVSTITALALLSAMATVTAAQETHFQHDWQDDLLNSNELVNVYYCDCGQTKVENIASIRDYVVTFDANGGEVDLQTAETRNNRLRKLPVPYRDSDYRWDGWYTEKEGGERVTADWVYDKDTTLYAHWTIVSEYTLTFASAGGSYIRPLTQKYLSTVDLDSYVPTKEGYTFSGWYLDPRTKQDRVTEYTFYENDVVYAKWEKNVTEEPVQEVQEEEERWTKLLELVRQLIQSIN